MRLLIAGRGLKLREDFQDYADRRLRFALGRFASEIDRVDVRLSDENSARGGPDKRCRIVAKLRSVGPVIVDDLDGDLRTALDRAADRMGRTVARSLERKRSMHSYQRRRSNGEEEE